MRRLLAALPACVGLSFTLLVMAPSAALAAEPRPRPPDAPERRDPRGAPPEGESTGGVGQRGASGSGGIGARRDRRPLEAGRRVRSAEELTRAEPMLAIEWREGGCAIDGHVRFVQALLAMENTSDLMSLEIWGDSHEYAPYQKVIYYLRVPRPAYVTMFWIGPKNDIFVPFQTLKVPADRDVSVDPESIVVPPLGREQWVSVATLEPLPLPCYATEREHLAWLAKVKQVPHGVGRWEVRSKPTR